MFTRRDLLKAGVISGAALALPWNVRRAFAAGALDPGTLTKYVDALPLLRVAQPIGDIGGIPLYEIGMTAFKQRLHRDLAKTTVWGYDGSFPGPTFETRTNEAIKVRWTNQLPKQHIFTVDPTIHGADGTPAVRTVAHLHGAFVEPESDGYPEAWFTQDFAKKGPAFEKRIYDYSNRQRGTTLWYHDHALGITRLNVCAGLAGLYIIRDAAEDRLGLPSGEFEIPLLIQDRLFNTDGSLLFPDQGGVPDVHPNWVPEFFGDTALVNGKVWPRLDVEPRQYRFRIVNGSNARFYNLKLRDYQGVASESKPAGPSFTQIGSDGGLLASPVNVPRLLIAPGERADVVIDFTKFAGQSLVVLNNAKAPFKGLGAPEDDEAPLAEVMVFNVAPVRSGFGTIVIPSTLRNVPRLSEASAVKTRDLGLFEIADPVSGEPTSGRLSDLMWEDPVTENPALGSTEIWRIFNTTEDVHPIHVHLVQFNVLDRQGFDAAAYLAARDAGLNPELKDFIVGSRIAPDPNEMGRKDTVRAAPGQVTRIIAKFDFPGRYVWHCHILDHEDNEMMRPYDIVGPAAAAMPLSSEDSPN